MDSKEEYQCFSYDMDTTDDDGPTSNPATPLTPHTPSTATSDLDTDRSGFSVSMDSGLGSPSTFSLPTGSRHNIIDVRSLSRQSTNKKYSCKRSANASEHTNKEKHRRERIKDSCDQLRVLLPYIRGRKTDMASILEMGVDYLRIVNMCMPQSLHDQIVEILSKDPTLVPNKDSFTLRGKKDFTKSEKAQQQSSVPPCGAIAELIEKTQKKPCKDMSLSEIADSCDILGSKHIRVPSNDLGDLSTDNIQLDARLEPTYKNVRLFTVAGHMDVAPPSFSGQSDTLYSKTSYTHQDNKTYSRVFTGSSYTDGYSTAQQIFNTYTANKSSILDANTYRPSYNTDTSLYHYYPNLVPTATSQSRLYATASDLVSPVLSSLPYNTVHNRLDAISPLSPDISSRDDCGSVP